MRRTSPRLLPIGRRLKQLRTEAGITLEKLAYESAGHALSKGYVSDIEAGKKVPSLQVVDALARRLGLPTFDLLVFPDQGLREQVVEATRRADEETLRRVLKVLEGG